MFRYKIYNFGGTNPYREKLIERLRAKFDFSQLSLGQYDITDDMSTIILGKDPTVALYWADGLINNKYDDVVSKLQKVTIPIIPIVPILNDTYKLLPKGLRKINAAELNDENAFKAIEIITNRILFLLGLLYKQQNVFISYRRAETEEAAKQIHIALVNNGFNAFLDKCDIPIGDDFQGILKQKLSNCSVLLLLESATFFKSRWTKEEYVTANNVRVEILDIKWPDIRTPREFDFNDSILLTNNDVNTDGSLTEEKINDIIEHIESHSARYYEARRQNIVGNFISDVRDKGRNAVQNTDGSITIDGLNSLIIPLIGVPQSWDYYKADKHNGKHILLLYDNQCILDQWMNHLKWIESKSNIQPIYVNDDISWISKNL